MMTKKEYHAPCIFKNQSNYLSISAMTPKRKPKKKIVFAIIRHVITFFGGALVAADIDPGIADQLAGSALGVVSAVASLIEKTNPTE